MSVDGKERRNTQDGGAVKALTKVDELEELNKLVRCRNRHELVGTGPTRFKKRRTEATVRERRDVAVPWLQVRPERP